MRVRSPARSEGLHTMTPCTECRPTTTQARHARSEGLHTATPRKRHGRGKTASLDDLACCVLVWSDTALAFRPWLATLTDRSAQPAQPRWFLEQECGRDGKLE